MAPKVPVPKNEAARLDRLRGYDVLDTPPGEAFDRVTRLASRLLKMPIALVSLVDEDRQWFKSRVGLDAEETSRELAFCAHAICDSSVMVVPNAQDDPRFSANPLVTGAPDIRFYAGAPLRTDDGHNMGTLCVIDRTPREFTEEERILLDDLAHIVIDELELHALANREQEARTRLHDAIEAAPDGFVYYDSEDRLALCNERYRQLYSGSADLMQIGRTFEEIIRDSVPRGQFPAAQGREEEWIAERLEAHRNPDKPIEQLLPNGRWVRIEERRTRDGGTVGFRTNITELKERELELEQLAQREQEARNRLIDAIETAPDGFVYYDRDDKLALCNERYRILYADSADLLVPGTPFETIIREGVARGQYPEADGNEEAWIRKRLEGHRNPKGSVEQELLDGRWLRIEERRTRDGGTVGFRIDITELKQREFELERLAATDSLTGAMNRRRFLEAGGKELRRGMRYDVPVSIILFDVDHFKKVNDTYGHLAGDEVLRQLVKVAKETLREHDLLCRYGGEEFAVLLPETDSAAAEVAAMRLRQAVEGSTIRTENGDIRITVSVGGTQLDAHSDSLESALSRADSGLYEAKEGGRNRVVFKSAATADLKVAL
jgi:diguanylate cyclase (GGDEF)-like protein